MKETVLITGASGFIGTNLVETLIEKSYRVIGIAKSFPLKDKNLKQFQSMDYIPFHCDITNLEDVKNIFKKFKPTIVVHLAAQAIVEVGISAMNETFDVNIRGTWNVLEACMGLKEIKRVIIASSDKAYGEHFDLPYKEEYELKAVYPYDVSKKITEELAMSFFHTHSLPVIITRCGNVFGPYDLNMSRIVPGTILSCLKNEKIRLRSDGQHKRCYVYSEDIVSAYLKIMLAPIEKVSGQVFNIGNETAISVCELVENICKIMGVNPKNNIVIKNTTKYEIFNQSLDCQKAKRTLDWEPNYTITSGLQKTIDWYSDCY